MKESERCHRVDCIYRTSENVEESHRCNYAYITGVPRIKKGMTPEEQLPCNCTEYVSGGEPLRRPRKRDQAWRSQALELHEQGLTVKEISRKTGATDTGVRRFLRRQGLTPHKSEVRNRPSRFNWKLAREMFSEKKTDKEIADALGCSVASVLSWRHHEQLYR